MSGPPLPRLVSGDGEMARERRLEFSPRPLVGHRAWRVARLSTGWHLAALGVSKVWVPDGHGAVAANLPPNRGGLFGIWAHRKAPGNLSRHEAYGTVQLWGRIVPHERGYRAEHARPLRIRIALGWRYRERAAIAREISARYHCDARPNRLPPILSRGFLRYWLVWNTLVGSQWVLLWAGWKRESHGATVLLAAAMGLMVTRWTYSLCRSWLRRVARHRG